MSRRIWIVICTALLFVGGLAAVSAAWSLADHAAAAPSPATDVSEAVSQAVAYLQANQLPNGGIVGWTPGEADDFATIKTVMAVSSAGYDLDHLTTISDRTPLDYLAARAITYTRDLTGTVFPGRAGMLAVAVIAGDADPHAFGGADLLLDLWSTYNASTGAFSSTAKLGFATGVAGTLNQTWSVLALAAAQEPVPGQAVDYLVGLQEADGGWGYGFGGDVDMTGVVVQTMIAAGLHPTSAPVREGLAFLRQAQDPSGGWASWGTLSPDSTGAAIQAVAAAGYVPTGPSWAVAGGGTPLSALLALQGEDGSFLNTVGTAHAIPGLTETPLPIFGRVQRANLALSWLATRQDADGSWPGWSGPDPGITSDAVLAYAAAGYDPATVAVSGSVTSAMNYLASSAASFTAMSPDRAGKLALAAAAGGADPSSFGGIDLGDAIMGHYSPTAGAFGSSGTFTNTWYQSLAILGLAAIGEDVPDAATEGLLALQQPDGGWRYDMAPNPWAGVNPENTSIAMQALIAAGVPVTDHAIISATAYLRGAQDAQGGWDENANATATAIQSLLAAGVDLGDWAQNGPGPYQALVSYQKTDGPFVWKWQDPWVTPDDNALATVQGTQALLGLDLAHIPAAPAGSFEQVPLGPDPDRLVAAQPVARLGGGQAWVQIPFGSDVNRNGMVALDWRLAEATDWITGTATLRADGYFTATVPVTAPVPYEFRATFLDVDGVQYGHMLTGSLSLRATLQPARAYLPLLASN